MRQVLVLKCDFPEFLAERIRMPIYEYRCSRCGHQQEFLQKLSDAPLTRCTACGEETFSKMVTAAGFQLKGSGWYATDFRNSGAKPAPKGSGDSADSAKSDSKTEGKKDAAAAAPACGSGACPACQ
jgi:putative FmdB family regulatory protein